MLSTAHAQAPLGRLELRSPPLPGTLVEALDLLNTPEKLDVKNVTAMVKRDPAVVARLMQTVNSAYYGVQRTIGSLDRAVVLLGPVAVTGIVVGMNILKLKSVLEGPAAACFLRLVRHSIATGFVTRLLMQAGKAGAHKHEESYTAGLLHDFGKIILVYNFPKEAAGLYEDKRLDDQLNEPDVRDVEQLLFGCDHTEAGAFAARKLNFPEALVEVINRHHDEDYSTHEGPYAQLLRATIAANLAVKAAGYAFTGGIEWENVLSAPEWNAYVQNDLSPSTAPEEFIGLIRDQLGDLDNYINRIASTLDTGSI